MIKLGVIMDPLDTLHFSKDSTLAILFEAAHRGWFIYYIQQSHLLLRNHQVSAKMQKLNLFHNKSPCFQLEQASELTLNSLDIILMRKDPPVDMNYIYATQLLDIAEKQGALIFNKPSSLRDANEKIFANWFPDCCPPTLISSDFLAIKSFLKEQKEIILKPVDGMGGRGIFRIKQNELNLNVILETLTQQGNPIIAQRFLPEIQAGDKRVLLIDGIPIDYALARIPAKGETRGNLAVGGKGIPIPLGKKERLICEKIGPILKEKGLFFVGLDIIGDYLTEINITSPTCIRELEKETPLKISQKLLDALEEKIRK